MADQATEVGVLGGVDLLVLRQLGGTLEPPVALPTGVSLAAAFESLSVDVATVYTVQWPL